MTDLIMKDRPSFGLQVLSTIFVLAQDYLDLLTSNSYQKLIVSMEQQHLASKEATVDFL